MRSYRTVMENQFKYKMLRQWQPTPVLLFGEPSGRRSLVGCSPGGREESDMTKWLHFPFSLSCTGEGNGNPLQCSCLENPRDGGAWWAAVYGVAQSRTRLKRLSSSNQSRTHSTQSLMKTIWKHIWGTYHQLEFPCHSRKYRAHKWFQCEC